jgi:pimeloyl-ACP methyl ester carboxylesterase
MELLKKSLMAGVVLLILTGALISPAEGQDPISKDDVVEDALPLAALEGVSKEYVVVEEALPFEALDGATAYWGVLGDAGYRIEIPQDWNGELVMWAHGYAGTGTELFVQNPPDGTGGSAEFRQHLITNGYAWAASSYSKNDYHVTTPAVETRQLAGQFDLLTGAGSPDAVYLAGVSMGGNITAYSAQRFRYVYDGVMPVCGVLADLDLFDFFLDVVLGAQTLGGAGTYPVIDPAQWIGGDVPTITANLSGDAPGWPTVLNNDGQNLKDLVELRSGGDRPNFDEGWAFWNSIPSDAGDGNFLFGLGIDTGTVPIDKQHLGNDDVLYQFDTDPAISEAEADFNAQVQRVEDAQLRRGDRSEIPFNSGRFRAPMLTMHNLGDLFVPFFNEIEFAERVELNGDPDLLVQRAIRGSGHCDFTTAEYVEAFEDLVDWVELGERPAGDEVLDPAAVAAADYGCAFTRGDHLAASPCSAPSDIDDDEIEVEEEEDDETHLNPYGDGT